MSFAENVRYYRIQQGLTQAQLQRLCGLSHGAISRIERGAIDPARVRVGTLVRLAVELEVTPNDLLDIPNPDAISHPE